MTEPLSKSEWERQRILKRIATNTAEVCSCLGCNRDRHKLAPWCTQHYLRYRRYGSPDGPIPTCQELNALDDVIREWIEEQLTSEKTREAFKKIWGTAVVSLRRPQSKAKGLWFLSGDTGLSQRERADILLANYLHRAKKPLGMAILRWMSCRLWAELRYEHPRGRRNFQKERLRFVNLHAGRYVVSQSGLTREVIEEVTIGYQKSIFAQASGERPNLVPIKEKRSRIERLHDNKTANVSKAIGVQLADAVAHVYGHDWQTAPKLLEAANFSLTQLNSKTTKEEIEQ